MTPTAFRLLLLSAALCAGARAGLRADEIPFAVRSSQGPATWRASVERSTLLIQAQGANTIARVPLDVSGLPVRSPCAPAARLLVLPVDLNGDGELDLQDGETARLVVLLTAADRQRLVAYTMGRDGLVTPLWQQDLPAASRGWPAATPVGARLRIAGQTDPQRLVVIVGRSSSGFAFHDALTGEILWSGAATGAVTQRIPGLTAPFRGAFAAVDLDRDGDADRLYAGDLQGTVWRFTLSASGAAPLLSGSAWARLDSASGGRGFVAPPDVALIAPRGAAAYLGVVLGTTSTGTQAAVENRLYLLRDRSLARDDVVTGTTGAITEANLRPAADGRGDGGAADGDGFWVPLGSGSVLARTLTLAGTVLFTTVDESDGAAAGCVPAEPRLPVIRVGAVSATTGAPALDLDGNGSRDAADLRVLLPAPEAPDSRVRFEPLPDAAGVPAARCAVGGQALADCPPLPPARRTDWRREDAD